VRFFLVCLRLGATGNGRKSAFQGVVIIWEGVGRCLFAAVNAPFLFLCHGVDWHFTICYLDACIILARD
jgi:hypothetical protein